MGVYSCSVFAYVLGVLVFASTLYVDGGSTSSFVRKVEKTIDMPLDADVFITPPGYNAPQQVWFLYHIFFLLLLSHLPCS